MNWLRSTLLLFACAGPAVAGDWPQWLGPRRDASTDETVPAWKGSLKELWRQPIGEGNSSPVVANGRVYVHTKIADKNAEAVVAFDAASGKELWRTPYNRAEFASLYGNGPRATPSVVDGKVFTHGITGVLTCFDAASGKIIWQVDTWKELSAPKLFFGAACSPLVDAGRIYLNVGGKGTSVAAFDTATGSVVWKNLDDRASYSSPILAGDGPTRQLVVFTGEGLSALDPAAGKLYWHFPLKDKLLESSTTPVVIGNRLLASAITYGSVVLRRETTGGMPGYTELWKSPELTSYFSTPVGVGTNLVYMVTSRLPGLLQSSEATLHCVDMATGKKLWSKAKVGEYHASLIRTADSKLLMLEEPGDLVLIDPDPSGYRELARAKVCGHTWAHAALANGKLYLRDDKDVICVELPK
jgi:outer membrane protein assembly factor BamB